MHSLKQTGSVVNYTAEFQQIAGRLKQNDSALISKYYIGLKDFIKDKLSKRENKLTDLTKIIEIAIKINTRV